MRGWALRRGEMEKWGNGEMEKWGNGEMGKWRNGEVEKWEKWGGVLGRCLRHQWGPNGRFDSLVQPDLLNWFINSLPAGAALLLLFLTAEEPEREAPRLRGNKKTVRHHPHGWIVAPEPDLTR